MWISLANHAKVALIFAQTDPAPAPPRPGLLSRRHRPARLHHPADPSQDGPARLGHRRRSRSTASSSPTRACSASVGEGFKIAMSALDSGRYSVAAGCVGICQGCVEESVAYAQAARAVRPPDRELSARAGDARRDARAHRRRPPARLARGRAARPGQAVHDRDLDRQALRHRGGAVVRQRGDPGPRRRGLRRRPSRRALVSRRPRDDALRGHVADPAAHHRPRADRHQRARAGEYDLTKRRPRAFHPHDEDRRAPAALPALPRRPPRRRPALPRRLASAATTPTTPSRRRSCRRCAPIRGCARLQPARLGADDRPPQGDRRAPRAPAQPGAGRRDPRRRATADAAPAATGRRRRRRPLGARARAARRASARCSPCATPPT